MELTNSSWNQVLEQELQKSYYQKLRQFLEEEYRCCTVYPKPHEIFTALELTSYEEVRVVILGQDPYHGPGQAHGLSFSVGADTVLPPSLLNIFKELRDDIGIPIPSHGNLTAWARQGVLLLNTVLTVREHMPNSHKGQGWERLTDYIIESLNNRKEPIIFVLWGRYAQMKRRLITEARHLVLESAHPSPLSARRGFFGSRPFSTINQYLLQQGREPINWSIGNLSNEPGRANL